LGQDQFDHGFAERASGNRRATNENDPATFSRGREHELAKVLVLRRNNAMLRSRQLDHYGILGAPRYLHYRPDVVPRRTKRAHHRKIATLVSEKLHGRRISPAR